MRTLQFKCTLLSDVIINQNSATEGINQTLDFIPGSNFLGIAAGSLYFDETHPDDKNKLSLSDSALVFHSGKVRFGDAHPAYDKMRTLRIPASMFYPKMGKVSNECYIHHHITDFQELKSKQLKQCRNGFYAFQKNNGQEVEVMRTFVIKSAYDREKRRSMDEKMYGYQSIDKGAEFFFEVELQGDVANFENIIEKALSGKKHVGRSRTAQYGLVEIEEYPFTESISQTTNSNEVAVYADGRLIFIDEYGQPTFQPTASDLGIDGGVILWEKSQIRTFQYAPWNFKRQARDTDRIGIEKGSVFIIDISKCQKPIEFTSKYIGSYQNEGFGKVIYNPEFLESIGKNGIGRYSIIEKKDEKKQYHANLENDVLLNYLVSKQKEDEMILAVYELVNKFVDDADKDRLFISKEKFASQWGQIRSIAMKHKSKLDLCQQLFFINDGNDCCVKCCPLNKEKVCECLKPGYLTHGVAKEKWEKRRIGVVRAFLKELTDENAQMALINLASEMSKLCSKNRKEKMK
jgi:hypothetical protein